MNNNKNTEQFQYTAFLLMYWIVLKGIPFFRHVGIYSEEFPTSFGGFYTELYRVNGNSYEEARNKIVEILKSDSHSKWILDLLSPMDYYDGSEKTKKYKNLNKTVDKIIKLNENMEKK